MKKIFFLLMLLAGMAFGANAQILKSKGDKKLNVSSTWYVTDVNGFQLIFADRQGRIENLKDLKAQDSAYDADVVVVKDEKFGDWRVAETLEESMSSDTALTPSPNLAVIRKKLSEIIEYKRTGRQ